jgi:hypothetical protein
VNQEMLHNLLATDTIILITSFLVSVLLIRFDSSKWLIISICQALCLITFAVFLVLGMMALWAAKSEVLLIKILSTDLAIFGSAGLAFFLFEINNAKKWARLFWKGLLLMSLVAAPVPLVMLVWM